MGSARAGFGGDGRACPLRSRTGVSKETPGCRQSCPGIFASDDAQEAHQTGAIGTRGPAATKNHPGPSGTCCGETVCSGF